MYFILENYLTPGSPNFSQFFDKRYNKNYSSLLLLTNAVSKDQLNRRNLWFGALNFSWAFGP